MAATEKKVQQTRERCASWAGARAVSSLGRLGGRLCVIDTTCSGLTCRKSAVVTMRLSTADDRMCSSARKRKDAVLAWGSKAIWKTKGTADMGFESRSRLWSTASLIRSFRGVSDGEAIWETVRYSNDWLSGADWTKCSRETTQRGHGGQKR